MKKMIACALVGLVAGVSEAKPPGTAELDAVLRSAVEQKRVPLAVAMVADSSGVVYEQAVGAKLDAIFKIASMTKPVTSIAVMQLVEAGRVKLDEPASTYVPELAAVRVLDGGTLRPPRSPITVRHLLTHTAGFSYEFMSPEILALASKGEVPSMMAGGDGFLKAPLLFDPGTRWEYGISTDWLGRLVERVSGRSLEAYFRERIFDPLGMPDSFFDVPQGKQARVVPTYQRKEDGSLLPQPPPPASVSPSRFFSGGGGLHSTASDYLKLVRALLAGGQLGSHRILSADSVAEMGRNQIGDLVLGPLRSVMPQFLTDGAVLPGGLEKFGLGFALNPRSEETSHGVDTLSWAGIFNTFFWIDREKRIGAVLMTQMLPGLDPGARKLLEDFDRAVYAWRARHAERER